MLPKHARGATPGVKARLLACGPSKTGGGERCGARAATGVLLAGHTSGGAGAGAAVGQGQWVVDVGHWREIQYGPAGKRHGVLHLGG